MFKHLPPLTLTLLFSFSTLGAPSPSRNVTSTTIDFVINQNSDIERFAFGSCNDIHRNPEQNFWNHIQQKNPQLWIWGGDIVYPDRRADFKEVLKQWEKSETSDPLLLQKLEDIRRDEFTQLKENKNYKAFSKKIPIFGVWDDHEYAYNNADRDYPEKDQSKQTLMSFLDIPNGHHLRSRPGMYHSILVGPPERQIHFIILDERFFSKPSEKILLGDEQWAWLEDQLKNSKAQLITIVSGISFNINVFVKLSWTDFSKEKNRLKKLIQASPIPILILSGDTHLAAIAKSKLGSKDLYELNSSGMTHVQDPVRTTLTRVNPFNSERELLFLQSQKNYAFVEVQWVNKKPRLKLQAINIDDNSVIGSTTWNP